MINTSLELRDKIRTWISEVPFTEFRDKISERVAGQEELTTFLAIVYNYLNCIADAKPVNCNTIIAAPSGCGKTETYRALRSYFNSTIPEFQIYIFDASQLTATGFKGTESSEILRPFFAKSMRDAIGICFLDELDKKLSPGYSSDGENVNASAINNILTIIEGGEFSMPKFNFTVNTSNLMFVGLGSFSQFREKRSEKKRAIGIFTEEQKEKQAQETDHYKPLTRENMITAGGSYEIIGRFPYIINYHKLSHESILKIINMIAKNSAESFDCEIELGQQMMDDLIESTDTEFGCRLISSKIRSELVQAYAEAIMNTEPGKILEICLEAPGIRRFSWREQTDAEKESDRQDNIWKNWLSDVIDVWDDDGSDFFEKALNDNEYIIQEEVS